MKNEFEIYKDMDSVIAGLPDDKKKFIVKYSLFLTGRMMWVMFRENSFPRKIFRHQFFMKSDMLGLLFRMNEICFAKLNYFRKNILQFEPYVYDCVKGFQKTALWDAEFLRHCPSGTMIDLRRLNRITEIDDFRKFCSFLENNAVTGCDDKL